MYIDLNKPGAFTLEAVRKLIASKDDSVHRQIRVSRNGILELSDVVGIQGLSDVKFRLETWSAGNGYSGAEAAQNEKWVSNVYETIEKAWKDGTTGYIDF